MENTHRTCLPAPPISFTAMCISSQGLGNLSSSGLCLPQLSSSRDHLQVGDEIEEGDTKGSTTEDLWSMSRELKYRHHEEVRLKLHDPEN